MTNFVEKVMSVIRTHILALLSANKGSIASLWHECQVLEFVLECVSGQLCGLCTVFKPHCTTVLIIYQGVSPLLPYCRELRQTPGSSLMDSQGVRTLLFSGSLLMKEFLQRWSRRLAPKHRTEFCG